MASTYASDLLDVADLLDAGFDWLAARGYELHVDSDLARWAAHLRAAPATTGVNPTFDPACSQVSAADSFWIDIRAGGATAACAAGRLFVTDDYLELKRSLRLWFDRAPRPAHDRLELVVPAGVPHISGRVGHEGGLWVHPQHRKRGLSMILPRLVRAICLARFDVDWQCGMNFDDLTRSGLPVTAYGFPQVVPCIDGFFALTGRVERIHMAYMSRAQLVAIQRDTVVRLRSDRHEQAVDAPAAR